MQKLFMLESYFSSSPEKCIFFLLEHFYLYKESKLLSFFVYYMIQNCNMEIYEYLEDVFYLGHSRI